MAERQESRREVPVCTLGDHNHIQGETINRAQLPLDPVDGRSRKEIGEAAQRCWDRQGLGKCPGSLGCYCCTPTLRDKYFGEVCERLREGALVNSRLRAISARLRPEIIINENPRESLKYLQLEMPCSFDFRLFRWRNQMTPNSTKMTTIVPRTDATIVVRREVEPFIVPTLDVVGVGPGVLPEYTREDVTDEALLTGAMRI